MMVYLFVMLFKLNSEVVIIDECEYFVSDVVGFYDVDGFISVCVCGSGFVYCVRGFVYCVEDWFNWGYYLEFFGGVNIVCDFCLVCINL